MSHWSLFVPVQSRGRRQLEEIRCGTSGTGEEEIHDVEVAHSSLILNRKIGRCLGISTLIIVVNEIFVHGVVELEVADSAGCVAGLDRDRPVGLEIDTTSVDWGGENVIPVLAVFALEKEAVPCVLGVARIVDDLIEIKSLHSIGGIHKARIPRIPLSRCEIGGTELVENCWALGAECDTTPEPR